jgi:transcription elongation factor GreA
MSKKYLLTQEGLVKLNDELKALITDKRPGVIERIREAAAHGDLAENADYAQAREEQSFIEGRIQEIEDMIKNAEIITAATQHNNVTIGSKIKVKVNGEEKEYAIVGSNEANPGAGKISNESSVGKALLGKKVGDKVTVATAVGDKEYEIAAIN